MVKNLLDGHWVFNAGNDPHLAVTHLAGFNVDIECRSPTSNNESGESSRDRCKFTDTERSQQTVKNKRLKTEQ